MPDLAGDNQAAIDALIFDRLAGHKGASLEVGRSFPVNRKANVDSTD